MANSIQPVQHIPIDSLGAGANILVAGTPGYSIRILGLVLSADGTVDSTLHDTVDNLALFNFVAGVPQVLPTSGLGWGSTGSGNALVLTVGAGDVVVSGALVYCLAPDHLQWGL